MKKYIFTLILSLPLFVFAQETHIITQSGMAFDPPTLNVNVGDTVKWIWTGGTHTTTSTTVPEGADEWNNPLTSTDTEFKYKVLVAGTYDYHCIPHQSMGMTGTIIASSTTDIHDSKTDKLAVYPNPVKDILFIKGLSDTKNVIEVYNIAGVLVSKHKLIEQNSINISSYKSGMYFIRVYNSATKDFDIIKFMKE